MTGADPGRRLTVVSYNVRRCMAADGTHRPERIAAVLDPLGADAIALQEIDVSVTLPGFVDQAAFLGRALGMEVVAGPILERRYGGYGNAVLTRLPIVAARRHALGGTRGEPRGAIDVELETAAGPIRLVATHLGLAPGDRREQTERIAEALDADERGLPTLLVGDLNEWRPWRRAPGALRGRLRPARLRRTWPAFLPLLPLDRVLARPGAIVTAVDAVRARPARRASDHLPLEIAVDPARQNR